MATSRFGLPQFQATDAVNRLDFNTAFSTLDDDVAGSGQGTASLATANGQVPSRSFYYNTSTGVLSYKYGDGTWRTVLTNNKVGNGLTAASDTLAVDAGDGLGFSGSALKVNTGATTDISSDALIVKNASLTQTQASSTYRFTRTGDPSSDVAQGDLSTNTSNELKVRNGSSAWQKPANLPWGVLAVVNLDNISSGLTTGDISGLSAAVTVGSNRMIRIRCVTPGVATTADGTASLQIKEGSAKYQESTVYCSALKTIPFSVETTFSPSSGSHTYKIAIETSQPATIQTGGVGSFKSAVLTIEDIGPSA